MSQGDNSWSGEHARLARDLAALASIPAAAWRLHHVATRAASAHVLATKANEVLGAADVSSEIRTAGYAAVEQAAEFLRAQLAPGTRDSA